MIIDAAAGAYALQGLDDNSRGDVETFTALYVQTFRLRGVATLVLDHVSEERRQGRGAFAIGCERKVGGADVHLGFETTLPLVRGGRGLYKITTHKDRLGHLPRPKAAELELRSDPETHALRGRSSAHRSRGGGLAADAADGKGVPLARGRSGTGSVAQRSSDNVRGKAEYVRAALRRARSTTTTPSETAGFTRFPACSQRQAVPGTTRCPPRPDPVPTPSRGVTNDPVPRPTPVRGDRAGGVGQSLSCRATSASSTT